MKVINLMSKLLFICRNKNTYNPNQSKISTKIGNLDINKTNRNHEDQIMMKFK